eukprot:TRINITY_DN55789_c0_g1_i2.p1 TRINITY_DN55789_c0_g1~~TRINITY_DN55789_c0_g1_i2.p1  ORF type:complete len:222 (+),score=19.66 TRINITY_DN55789_c0_g1_i2:56-667(+)
MRPVTSVSLIYLNKSEEPPLGFEIVSKTTGGLVANLNVGVQGGNQIFLCLHRGDGAPLSDIAISSPDTESEPLPTGFHEVKYTPFGNKANLNTGGRGPQLLLAFRPSIVPVFKRFQLERSASQEEVTQSRCLALLMASCFSYDEKLVQLALNTMTRFPPVGAHPHLFNVFISSICDTTPLFFTYFTTNAHTTLIEFLVRCFTR